MLKLKTVWFLLNAKFLLPWCFVLLCTYISVDLYKEFNHSTEVYVQLPIGNGSKYLSTIKKFKPAFAKAKEYSQPVVPRVVHIIWYYPREAIFRFHHLISVLSAYKFIKPTKIILWHNNLPTGPWWLFLHQLLPHIVLMPREPPTSIHGLPVQVPEHQSDITRIEVLLKYGGIYMDLDVVALRSFDPLLKYNVTMGAETPDLLGSGLILSSPNSTFLQTWYDSYRDFDDTKWNEHSVRRPMALAKSSPSHIHVEWFSLQRPNWSERDWLYKVGRLWDWSENYAVHLWYRTHDVEYDPDTIRTLNTTMGEIFRYIYYGSPNLL